MARFCVVDLETTGFPPNASVMEIGWTILDEAEGEYQLTGPFSKLTKPEHQLTLGALATHHIRVRDVADAQPCRDALVDLANLEEVDYWVAHNAAFEQKFFTPSTGQWICTMKCGYYLYPEAPQHTNQVLKYYLENTKGLEFDDELSHPPHRAGPDTYVTALLLMQMIKDADDDIEKLVTWSSRPRVMRTLPFGKHKGVPCTDVPLDYWQWLLGQKPDEDVKFTAQYFLYHAKKDQGKGRAVGSDKSDEMPKVTPNKPRFQVG